MTISFNFTIIKDEELPSYILENREKFSDFLISSLVSSKAPRNSLKEFANPLAMPGSLLPPKRSKSIKKIKTNSNSRQIKKDKLAP